MNNTDFTTEIAEDVAANAKAETQPKRRVQLTLQQRRDNCNASISKKKAEIAKLTADIKELEKKAQSLVKLEEAKIYRSFAEYMSKNGKDPIEQLQKLIGE